MGVEKSPVLATGLSPLDGVLVPTLGSLYVSVTLLFPFVAIRTLGQEKESGTLSLLIQLPYRPATLIFAKLIAILAALLLVAIPALSSLVIWTLLGGHNLSARDFQSSVWASALRPAGRRACVVRGFDLGER